MGHPLDVKVGKRLTQREIRVLDGMARGLTDAQISREVEVKPSTVHTYKARIRLKLGAVNAPHCVALGFARGYLKLRHREAVPHVR
jgi:DNA-binding NarL/FixJ family response regulator